MNEEVSRLVSGALGQNPAGQLAFAEKIPMILQFLDTDSVRTQFLPFFTSWIPVTNSKVLLVIASVLDVIVRSTNDIKLVSPIADILLAIDDSEISDSAEHSLRSLTEFPIGTLIAQLLPSRYDCVRAFLVRLLLFECSEAFLLETIKTMISDKSFLVRISLAKNISRFSTTVAETIALSFVRDAHPRIRAQIAHDFPVSLFYFETIAPVLSADVDWNVRCAVAVAVGSSTLIEQAAPIAVEFVRDDVCEVKLFGLRSITKILTENPNFTVRFPFSFNRLMNESPIPFRISLIDFFFVQKQVRPCAFVSRVLKDEKEVKLHFLEAVSRSTAISKFGREVLQLASELSCDRQWRIRFGVASLLLPIFWATHGVSQDFEKIATAMLDDEAFPVRSKAIEFLGVALGSTATAIPEFVINLGSTESFRKRQSAVGLFRELFKATHSANLKGEILKQLAKFRNDPVVNVAYVAGLALAELDQAT
jgi:hypothetical protein